MTARLWLAGLLAVLLCTAGCSAAPAVPTPAFPSTAPSSTAPSAEQPRPTRVAVLGRKVDGPLIVEGLGLDENGGTAEPPVEDPGLGSWYNLGPRPGAPGPAVILGHVNGRGKLGLFAHLQDVRSGDRIEVSREDGTKIAFSVYRTVTIEKTAFPAEQVYGNTEGPEIRLVTCGGELDRVRHRYLSNVLVFGRLAS